MISIFGPPSRRVWVKNVIGKLRRNSAVRNETQKGNSWILAALNLDWFFKDGSRSEKRSFYKFVLCHIHSRTLFYLHSIILWHVFPIHDCLHQCVSAFSFGDDGRRGDRLFSPRNDAQQATRLPHCSVERDHDALNEGCTACVPVYKNKLVQWTFSANTCVRPPPLDTACVIMAQINYGHTVTMPRDLLQHRVSNDPQKIARNRRVRRHT